MREYHQRLTPEHLLKALLDDEEGAAAGLLRAAGADPKAAQTAVDAEVARIPRCRAAAPGSRRATPELVRVLDAAERDASKAGDEFVAQDRLLLALAGATRRRRARCARPAPPRRRWRRRSPTSARAAR